MFFTELADSKKSLERLCYKLFPKGELELNGRKNLKETGVLDISKLTNSALEKIVIDKLVQLCDRGELGKFFEHVESFVKGYLEHRWGENWIEKNTACGIGQNWEKAKEEIKINPSSARFHLQNNRTNVMFFTELADSRPLLEKLYKRLTS